MGQAIAGGPVALANTPFHKVVQRATVTVRSIRSAVLDSKQDVGLPSIRGGFLYAATGWWLAVVSKSMGDIMSALVWRRVGL